MTTKDILLMLEAEANAKGVDIGSYQHNLCKSAAACILEKVKLADDAEMALNRAVNLAADLTEEKAALIKSNVELTAMVKSNGRNARQQKKHKRG